MSSPKAIAAVTQTLAVLLEKALQADDASFKVSALPLDKSNTITSEPNRLNVFLFQVSQHAAWRNTPLPDRTRLGENGNPPLALNLSYMLTAYGEPGVKRIDHHILGRAMQFLNDHAVLTADEIRTAFPDTRLETQLERVRIVPRTLSLEEMVRMWGTFMTQYRISAAYDISVVLIESAPRTAGLPVLRRGNEDLGPDVSANLPPSLSRVLPPELLRRGALPTYQAAARVGDTIMLEGDRLDAQDALLQIRATAWEPRAAELAVKAGTREDTLDAVLKDPPPETNPPAGGPPLAWAPGVYTAAIVIRRAGKIDIVSNVVPFAVAPRITVAPTAAAAGNLDISVTCTPAPRPEQHVVLVLPNREPLTAGSITPPAGPGAGPTFKFTAKALAHGTYVARLRVDGVDSLPYLVVKPPNKPPQLEYDPAQTMVIT